MSEKISHLGFYTSAYNSPKYEKENNNDFFSNPRYRCEIFDTKSQEQLNKYETLMTNFIKNPNKFRLVARNDYNYDFSMFVRIEYLESQVEKENKNSLKEKEEQLDEIIDSLFAFEVDKNKEEANKDVEKEMLEVFSDVLGV